MSWRDQARPVIQRVLSRASAEGWDEKTIKRALFEAYPFGPRRYHPYKIWCNEIKRQRRAPPYAPGKLPSAPKPIDPRQGDLW